MQTTMKQLRILSGSQEKENEMKLTGKEVLQNERGIEEKFTRPEREKKYLQGKLKMDVVSIVVTSVMVILGPKKGTQYFQLFGIWAT